MDRQSTCRLSVGTKIKPDSQDMVAYFFVSSWIGLGSESMSRVVLLTGRPRIGKTTVLMKAIDLLRERGWVVGGMVSSEIRRSGRRVGFSISDLESGKSGILAHIELREGPSVGKYRVNLEDLEHIGVGAIQAALRESEIVCCDEIAPMELSSPIFRETIRRALQSGKPLLATIHEAGRDSLLQEIKKGQDLEILEVTAENRDTLHLQVVRLIESNLNMP